MALHRDAQRLLEPLAVVNPFADRLTFADGRTRTRRDHGKYLNLIAAVTLLHQHQRARKTATINGHQVAYVESTVGDIEVANRLAHAVLGQSLDELAPQTRRLLLAVHAHVGEQAADLAVDVSLVRFTRRQLREALHSSGAGWGDTQLKVHLARLVDLELLHVHRTDSGSYGYELTWRPPTPAPTSGDVDGDRRDVDGGRGDVGQGYGRFLVGLTDPATLYDTNRSGPQGAWSGGGRPLVGGRSGPGRPTPESPRDAAEQHEQGEIDAQVDPVPPDALIGLHGLADVRRGA